MKVTVKLIGCLEICSKTHEWHLQSTPGSSLYDVLQAWLHHVPADLKNRITHPEEANFFTGFYLVCNNKHVNLHELKDTLLREDAVIIIVSPVAGG
jgi:molybdopterin converting factor small subunit